MTYEKLVKLLPYPVKIEYGGMYSAGAFVWGDGIHHRPYCGFEPYVQVNPSLSKIERMVVLIHELGHAICHREHCKCYTEYDGKNKYLPELHAYRFFLKFTLKHKMTDILRHEYDIMDMRTDYPALYQEVVDQIKTERIWRKATKYLEKHK